MFKVAQKRPEFIPKKFDFDIHKSIDDFANDRGFLQECKETMLHVASEELPKFQSELDSMSKRSIEAPWGENIVFDSRTRYSFAEQLFVPIREQLPENWPLPVDGVVETWHNDYVPLKRAKPGLGNKEKEGTTESTPALEETSGDNPSNSVNESGKRPLEEAREASASIAGLANLVNTAIMETDVDLRATLAHNLVVTGGSSSILGLADRLMTELNKKLPALKFRILTSGHLRERQSRAWLGGSILSSLGTFHQLWVGRQEYEEVGAERLLKDRFR